MGKKILALVSEPIDGEALKKAVGSEDAEDAEVLVVAPALDHSKARFWTSDADGAIGRAQEVAEESAERMDEQGVDAAGDTGESDPLLALQDALTTFEADEIVLCTHPAGDQTWLEEGLLDEARERFDPPIRHIEIESD
jgi:hypothetical protein